MVQLIDGSMENFSIARDLNKFNVASLYLLRNTPRRTRTNRTNGGYLGFETNTNWIPREIESYKNIVSEDLTNPKTKEAFELLMAYFEERINVPNEADSNLLAQGTIDNAKSNLLIIDQKSGIKANVKPNIKISIVRVKNQKFDYGFEITIDDGPVIPLYIGSKEALFVYLLTLLKQKLNKSLSKKLFNKPIPTSTLVKRDSDVVWLETIYNKVFPNEEEKFDDWYKKSRERSCHAISQGKGNANRAIKKILADYEDVLWYCSIQDGNSKPRYYFIDIPADKIDVPRELMI